jgi:flagellin-like protein
MAIPGGKRAVTSVNGVIILVAITVILASTVLAFGGGFTDRNARPSFAVVEAEVVTLTFPDSGECPPESNDEELGVRVTMTQFSGADRIYVQVRSEGATNKKVLWADPSADTVGETLTLANELTSFSSVDVDIGGGNDFAFCPGEQAVIEIYAERDGRVQLLQELTVE